MILGMFTDGRYYWDGKDRFYTRTNWKAPLLSEYAAHFDEIRLFCRCVRNPLADVEPPDLIDIPNIRFVRLPDFSGFSGFLKQRRQITEAIRRELCGVDVCFLRIPGQISTTGIRAAVSMGIPTVCQLVGDSQMVFRTDETIIPTSLLRMIASKVAFYQQYQITNRCDFQASVSVELARKYCRRPERTEIIPNTLLSEHSFLPFRPRSPEEPLSALYVGRLEHHKNPQLFLYAVAALRKKGYDIRTTLVGKGGYLPFLQHLAGELGIADSVCFAGYVRSREKLLEYYRRAHLLYLLSFTEGLGMVLMEAGAAALPIIGSRAGGIPELAREGQNAFLIHPNDVQGCVEAVQTFCDHEPVREKMGRSSQAIMREYTMKRVAEKAARLLRSAARKGRDVSESKKTVCRS